MSDTEEEKGRKKDSKMHVWIDMETADTLRGLAAALKVFIRRGQGAKQVGNVAGLFQVVAGAWLKAPEIVLALFAIIQGVARTEPDAIRPWTSLSCGHIWLGQPDPVPEVCQVCGDSTGKIQAVVDPRRVLGTPRPYEGETAWVWSANAVLGMSTYIEKPL